MWITFLMKYDKILLLIDDFETKTKNWEEG